MNPRFFLLVALAASEALAVFQCKNEFGKDVEWFIIYKLPKTSKREGSDFDTHGTELVYIDANSRPSSKPWRLLKANVSDDTGNPLAHTLDGLFKKTPKNSLYVVYNDQPPRNYKGSANGHTKGVVEFNDTEGYWLMHTVPHFPYDLFSGKYKFPDSGLIYGQVFMCVSLGRNQLPKVVAALRHQLPYIYEGDAPKSFRQDQEVSNLLDKKFVHKPMNPILDVELLGSRNTAFRSFAKHREAKNDIYSSVIAPRLGVDLFVETWQNGAGGKLGSCTLKGGAVSNLANVIIHLTNGQKVNFKTSTDHSKWAISTDNSKPWFCIGSLNRMQSQFMRGGQTTCISNKIIHRAFISSIETYETCKGDIKHYSKKSNNGQR